MSSPAPLNCGDAARLTSCHRALVSNSYHFLRAPANHFRWRSRQPPGSVGYRWPFRHCDSEHRLSIFELGRRRFGGKPLLHTGSLTNNANPPSRSFWSLSPSVKSTRTWSSGSPWGGFGSGLALSGPTALNAMAPINGRDFVDLVTFCRWIAACCVRASGSRPGGLKDGG